MGRVSSTLFLPLALDLRQTEWPKQARILATAKTG